MILIHWTHFLGSSATQNSWYDHWWTQISRRNEIWRKAAIGLCIWCHSIGKYFFYFLLVSSTYVRILTCFKLMSFCFFPFLWQFIFFGKQSYLSPFRNDISDIRPIRHTSVFFVLILHNLWQNSTNFSINSAI